MSDTIKFCKCGDDANGQNFGTSGCLTGIDVLEDLYFMAIKKADGTTNGIKSTDTLDPAFFDAKFKNPIFDERWYSVKGVENIESTPPDSNKFTYPSGREVVLSKGIRLFVAVLPIDDPNKMQKKLETLKCRKGLGIMAKDRAQSLVGQTTVDSTEFEAREIIDGTFDFRVFNKTDTDDPKVEISFQYARRALDGDVDFILQSSMGGFSLNDVISPIDANIVITASTLASISFSVFSDFNEYQRRTPLGGLDLTHLDVFNNTNIAVEPTSGITELTTGDYVITYTTPVTAADLMEVRGILAVYFQIDYDIKRFIGVELAAS